MLNLWTKEGTVVQCCKKGAKLSNLLAKSTTDPVRLDLSTALVQKIVDYLNHHGVVGPLKMPKPAPDDLSSAVGEWDAAFIDTLNMPGALEMILAADHMGIPSLVDLAMGKVAVTLRNKSLQEGRHLFFQVRSTKPSACPATTTTTTHASMPQAAPPLASIGDKLSFLHHQANLAKSNIPSFSLD